MNCASCKGRAHERPAEGAACPRNCQKETEKLFAGTEVVHNPVKEFVPLKDVKVGQEVCIAELNQLATVLALPDKNGDVLVRAGIIKTKVPLKGLKQPEKLVKNPLRLRQRRSSGIPA